MGSRIPDKEFKKHVKDRVKKMAKEDGPVELPRDLALDDRIPNVSFKTKPSKGGSKTISDATQNDRAELEEYLRTTKREKVEKTFSQKEEKFTIQERRLHTQEHGAIPSIITGDEFNDMSETRRKMLLRLSTFNAIVVRNMKGTESMEEVGRIIRSIPLMQREVRIEADSTVVSYILDNALGFYVCFIFPRDGKGYFQFYYSCNCENNIEDRV